VRRLETLIKPYIGVKLRRARGAKTIAALLAALGVNG
jgi:hypothetical protein